MTFVKSSLFWGSPIGLLLLWFRRLLTSWFDRGLLNEPETSVIHVVKPPIERLPSSNPCYNASCVFCDKAAPSMLSQAKVETPYFDRKPSHRLRCPRLSHVGFKDRCCHCRRGTFLDKDAHIKEISGTGSPLHGGPVDDPDLDAIAAEGPKELFNSSMCMSPFKNKFERNVYYGTECFNSESDLWEVDHVLPLAASVNLSRPDMRELLREADEELPPSWSTTPPEILPGLMVIDCFSGNVVAAQPGCDYVALSYVWGSEATLDRSMGERFQLHLDEWSLPQTVQDAMNVVRALGMQFLWVDRYCIHGTEPAMKHYMISNMDAIYVAAYLTIIAASGSNDEHGLPSVSKSLNSVEGDYVPPWDGIVCTMFSSEHHEQIEQSAWSKRGWTYQEGLLSRRRLIFTDDFAILHYRGNDRVNVNSGIFFHINEYSRRNLTYPSDFLKAFLGTFRAYERLQMPAVHVWGIPFLLDSDGNIRHLSYGLLWRVDRHSLRRNLGLPSWTWAGWYGWSTQNVLESEDFWPDRSCSGPYKWLLEKVDVRLADQSWGTSDISLEILAGEHLTDISHYFRRAFHGLPFGESAEPAPILYLTAWSTTVTTCVLPDFSVCLEGEDWGSACVKLDFAPDWLSSPLKQVNGCWRCKWTAAVIHWRVSKAHGRGFQTQSLLLKRMRDDIFRRVGIIETDWYKSDLDKHGRMAPFGRSFTRTKLRIV